MSWQAVTWSCHVLDTSPDLTTSQRLVLLVIAEHADRTGVAWPSVDRIAARCGMHAGSVRRAIRVLEAAGAFTTSTGGGRSSNRYRFPVTAPVEPAAEISTPRAPVRGLDGSDPAHQGAHPAHQRASSTRTSARRTSHITGQEPPRSSLWCGPTCPHCDGTGWEVADETTRTVQPCRGRATA